MCLLPPCSCACPAATKQPASVLFSIHPTPCAFSSPVPARARAARRVCPCAHGSQDGAGPGGVPGVVNIYPGLCNKNDWANCTTGTLLAQAVPANYAGDPLLTNWTKPSCAPSMRARTGGAHAAAAHWGHTSPRSLCPPPHCERSRHVLSRRRQPDHRVHAARPIDAMADAFGRVAAAH
eukprot:2381538-Prymnesium_polylepis.1